MRKSFLLHFGFSVVGKVNRNFFMLRETNEKIEYEQLCWDGLSGFKVYDRQLFRQNKWISAGKLRSQFAIK